MRFLRAVFMPSTGLAGAHPVARLRPRARKGLTATPTSPVPPCGLRKSSGDESADLRAHASLADLRKQASAPSNPTPKNSAPARRHRRRRPQKCAEIGWRSPSSRRPPPSKNGDEAETLKDQAAASAWLAFRHARGKPEAAAALALLGEIFAAREAWRDALNAYRASLDAAPTPAAQKTYDDLREKYGFRVLDYKVDNKSATPARLFPVLRGSGAEPHRFFALRDAGRRRAMPPFRARTARFASRASSMASAIPSPCARGSPRMSAKICSNRWTMTFTCVIARRRLVSPVAITCCRASDRKARRWSRSTRRRSRSRFSASATAISCRSSAPAIFCPSFRPIACASSATATARRSGRARWPSNPN